MSSTFNAFSGKDICEIIKQCAKSRVSELRFGDLFVRFDAEAKRVETNSPEKASQEFPSGDPEKTTEVLEDANILLRSEAIDEEINSLIISDPDTYEEMLSRRELEDGPESEEA